VVSALGQFVYLHGINVHEAAKYEPTHLLPLSAHEVEILLQSGFDAVRLLSGWEAIMPERGQLDQDYLDRYSAEVDKLTAAGMFVIVDMHQDVWGDPFGNGAPGWACPDELKEGYQPTTPWWANYFSSQVGACFDNFWASDELQDQLADAWAAVAGRVCANESVIGFDLLNEPYPGGALGEMDFDQRVLYPFYQKLMGRIREVCPDRVFFIEPSRTFDFGLADPLEIPASDRGRVVLAPHFYPQSVHEQGAGYDGDKQALEKSLSDLYGGFEAQGVPLWFGEYGGLTGNPNYDQYLVDINQIFYEHLWGSALWAFSRGDGGFSLLDAVGTRKAVFDNMIAAPVPVLLPSRPKDLKIDFDQPGIEFVVNCKNDLLVQIMLTASGSWTVSFDPPGSLTQPEVSGHLLTAACRGSTPVSFQAHLEK
jgi:endoglycosylceramidase